MKIRITQSVALFALLLACEPLDEEAATSSEPLAQAESKACTVTELISAKEIGSSERAAFTDEGRLFIIGTRISPTTLPTPTKDFGSFVFEVKREGGAYVLAEYVAGALEGTVDGKVGSAKRGTECLFSGLTVKGAVLYAGCATLESEAALVQIDTRNRTVRAGAFTSCNFEPSAQPCSSTKIYPNGMAVDAAGRIYTTNMQANLLANDGQSGHSIAQITIQAPPEEPWKLSFVHRAWLAKNLFVDGIAPNGIQIDGDTLFYVGGANVNAVPILPDGRAGKLRVHFRGPLLTYTDDFALRGSTIVLARTLPSAVVGLAPAGRTLRELNSCPMTRFVPSSLTFSPSAQTEAALFPPDTLVVTSFFGGGLYTLR